MFFIKTIICFVHLSFFSFLLFFFVYFYVMGNLMGRVFLGTKWKDQNLGPKPHVGT